MNDLLAPLEFTHADLLHFIRDRACALCRGHYLEVIVYGKNHAICAICGELAFEHNHVSKSTLKLLENEERVTRQELHGERIKAHPEKRRSEEQILKELGF